MTEENKTAHQYFSRAIEIDPNFAPGHYGYSLAQFFDFWMYSTRPLSDVTGTALEEARTAVSLDDKDAMAHAVLSFMWLISGEWDSAIAEGRIAIALNPNSPWSMGMLGTALGWGGYRAEGIEWMRRTLRASPRDPLSWAWFFWMGMFQYFERDFPAAITSMTEVTRLRPRFGSAHHAIAACLAFLGRSEEAERTVRRARAQISGHLTRFQGARAPWQRPEDFAFLEEGRRSVAEIEKSLAG